MVFQIKNEWVADHIVGPLLRGTIWLIAKITFGRVQLHLEETQV